VSVIERLEALAGQRWQYRCPECLTVGVEQWSVCAGCASERPPRRIDLFDEMLNRAAPDLLKLARTAERVSRSVARWNDVLTTDQRAALKELHEAQEPLFREDEP
jgi:hypothetical protein